MAGQECGGWARAAILHFLSPLYPPAPGHRTMESQGCSTATEGLGPFSACFPYSLLAAWFSLGIRESERRLLAILKGCCSCLLPETLSCDSFDDLLGMASTPRGSQEPGPGVRQRDVPDPSLGPVAMGSLLCEQLHCPPFSGHYCHSWLCPRSARLTWAQAVSCALCPRVNPPWILDVPSPLTSPQIL